MIYPSAIANVQPTSDGEKRIPYELNRIREKLSEASTPSNQYCQLYAAQQALEWVLNPEVAAPPYAVIVAGKVQPLTSDTRAG